MKIFSWRKGMIKAVLFDMDGVLIDAREWHYEALNESLALFGYKISLEAHITTYDGLPTKKKLKLFSQIEGLPTGLHDLINELKQIRTLALSHAKCKPTFNHIQTLSSLKRLGYKTAVCSNSIRNTVETMMKLSRLEEFLDATYSNEDVSLPKPNPEIYLTAMEDLKIKPNETLILEDNMHGIKAAHDSGAHVMEIAQPADVDFESIYTLIKELNRK